MLDLSDLEPEPQKVTLKKGVAFELYPAKVRSLIAIERYFKDLKDMKEHDVIDRALEILRPLIPEMDKNPNIDFNSEQVVKLLQYIYTNNEVPIKEKKGSKKKDS